MAFIILTRSKDKKKYILNTDKIVSMYVYHANENETYINIGEGQHVIVLEPLEDIRIALHNAGTENMLYP